MTLRPELQKILELLNPAGHVDMARFEAALLDVRYTGITVTHWLNGRAKQIDLGAPIRLSIVEGEQRPLDKAPMSKTG